MFIHKTCPSRAMGWRLKFSHTQKEKLVTMVTSISPKMRSNRPPFHPPVWL